MTAILGRVIFGIPILLTGLIAKGTAKLFAVSTTFLAELIGILLFKARWWVAAIAWTFVLYGMILLDPFVKRYASPIHGVYNRFIIVIMGLMLLAYATKNLRRAFRRARLEVRVLNTVSNVRKNQVGPTVQVSKSKTTNLWSKFVQTARNRSRVNDRVTVDVTVPPETAEESYEATAARMMAEEQAQVNTGLSGETFQEKERPDWMKSRKSKSARADTKDPTGADPWERLIALEKEAESLRKSAERKDKKED